MPPEDANVIFPAGGLPAIASATHFALCPLLSEVGEQTREIAEAVTVVVDVLVVVEADVAVETEVLTIVVEETTVVVAVSVVVVVSVTVTVVVGPVTV